jgi:hypothetical protein
MSSGIAQAIIRASKDLAQLEAGMGTMMYSSSNPMPADVEAAYRAKRQSLEAAAGGGLGPLSGLQLRMRPAAALPPSPGAEDIPVDSIRVTPVDDDGWCLYRAVYQAYTGNKPSILQAWQVAIAMADLMRDDPSLDARIADALREGIITQEVAGPDEVNKKVVAGVQRRTVKTRDAYIEGLITPRESNPSLGPRIWPEISHVLPNLTNLLHVGITVYQRFENVYRLREGDAAIPGQIMLLHDGENHFDILGEPLNRSLVLTASTPAFQEALKTRFRELAQGNILAEELLQLINMSDAIEWPDYQPLPANAVEIREAYISQGTPFIFLPGYTTSYAQLLVRYMGLFLPSSEKFNDVKLMMEKVIAYFTALGAYLTSVNSPIAAAFNERVAGYAAEVEGEFREIEGEEEEIEGEERPRISAFEKYTIILRLLGRDDGITRTFVRNIQGYIDRLTPEDVTEMGRIFGEKFPGLGPLNELPAEIQEFERAVREKIPIGAAPAPAADRREQRRGWNALSREQAAAPLPAPAAAQPPPDIDALAQEARRLQAEAEAASAALVTGTAIPVRLPGTQQPASSGVTGRLRGLFSRTPTAATPSTASPVGRLSSQNLNSIRSIIRQEVAAAIAKMPAPVVPYAPGRARDFPPSIQELLDIAVRPLPIAVPPSKPVSASAAPATKPTATSGMPKWAQWIDIKRVEGECKNSDQCIANAVLDEINKGEKFINEDRLAKRPDKRMAAYIALQAEYTAKKQEAETNPSAKVQSELAELEEKLRARYPDGGVNIIGPGGSLQHYKVPNPYVAQSYREDPTVTFAAPATTANDAHALNVAVLEALVPTQAQAMIDDKQMAIALLESLWFCGSNPTLSDDPRCFPLRLLGELREYEAMKGQHAAAEDATAVLAKPWGVLNTWMTALKNALGKGPIYPYPYVPAVSKPALTTESTDEELEKKAQEIEAEPKPVAPVSPAQIDTMKLDIENLERRVISEHDKLVTVKNTTGQKRFIAALIARLNMMTLILAEAEKKDTTPLPIELEKLEEAIAQIKEKNKAAAPQQARLAAVLKPTKGEEGLRVLPLPKPSAETPPGSASVDAAS